MFTQQGKPGDNKGNRKEKDQRTRRSMDHITCNEFGEEGHYTGNNYCPTQFRLIEDAEAFRKMNQEKSSNKPPGGGDHEELVSCKDALCSLMMGYPNENGVNYHLLASYTAKPQLKRSDKLNL